MKSMMFRCTLVSDVIINQTAATEGGNSTLDFIPGNIFGSPDNVRGKHYLKYQRKHGRNSPKMRTFAV